MSKAHQTNENEKKAPNVMFTSNHTKLGLKALNGAKVNYYI